MAECMQDQAWQRGDNNTKSQRKSAEANTGAHPWGARAIGPFDCRSSHWSSVSKWVKTGSGPSSLAVVSTENGGYRDGVFGRGWLVGFLISGHGNTNVLLGLFSYMAAFPPSSHVDGENTHGVPHSMAWERRESKTRAIWRLTNYPKEEIQCTSCQRDLHIVAGNRLHKADHALSTLGGV